MAFRIPTTTEIIANILAALESRLNQVTPLAQLAYNRVISVALGLALTPLYKYSANRAEQCFALTADAGGLAVIADNYGLPPRTPAQAAEFTATLPVETGVTVPATATFVGSVNGVRYRPTASATEVGGIATLNLVAFEAGAVGNLEVGDTLTIVSQIAGAGRTATVTDTASGTTGADQEDLEDFRQRILDFERNPGGGGNPADYRNWAQETPGVARAFPFRGQPTGSGLPSVPPDRTVYIEAQAAIDPDGVAPTSLLDDALDFITTDPVTGEARQPLGLTDDTLYVESIARVSFYVVVRGLAVDASREAQAKADIEDALTIYAESRQMFVDGLDPEEDRADTVTGATLGAVVSDALVISGGTAESVTFDIVAGGTVLASYTLKPGELGKLGSVDYA